MTGTNILVKIRRKKKSWTLNTFTQISVADFFFRSKHSNVVFKSQELERGPFFSTLLLGSSLISFPIGGENLRAIIESLDMTKAVFLRSSF